MNKTKKFLSIITMMSVVVMSLGPIAVLPAYAIGETHHFKIATGGDIHVWERDIEFIYLDTDTDEAVSIDDVRIATPIGFNAGSVVVAGNSDIGNDLYTLTNAKITGGVMLIGWLVKVFMLTPILF